MFSTAIDGGGGALPVPDDYPPDVPVPTPETPEPEPIGGTIVVVTATTKSETGQSTQIGLVCRKGAKDRSTCVGRIQNGNHSRPVLVRKTDRVRIPMTGAQRARLRAACEADVTLRVVSLQPDGTRRSSRFPLQALCSKPRPYGTASSIRPARATVLAMRRPFC